MTTGSFNLENEGKDRGDPLIKRHRVHAHDNGEGTQRRNRRVLPIPSPIMTSDIRLRCLCKRLDLDTNVQAPQFAAVGFSPQ